MSREELINFKKEVYKLYNNFLYTYATEASRGNIGNYRERVVKPAFDAFNKENQKLPEHDRIVCNVTLKLTA